MQQYSSPYSNYAHQLVVSVSKHLYATKTNQLKYQIKPFDISLADLPGEKEHVVIFALRDHFSGVSYAEVRLSRALGTLRSFLANAWGHKPDYPFCGVSELLLLPKAIESAFPGIASSVEQLGTEVLSVASGFQTNIGDIKVIENRFKTLHGESSEVLQDFGKFWSSFSANEPSRVRDRSKLELWKAHLKEIVVPGEKWGDA